MTLPPPPPQSGPFGVPPGRFTPPTQHTHEPRRRDLGTDPALERSKRRRWLPWLLGGIGATAVVVLVVAIIISSFSAPNPIEADPEVGPVNEPPATANPTSSFEPAAPTSPPPGSTIPISMDVEFPDGMTFVMPSPGDWSEGTVDRQPDAVVMEDPISGAYIQFLQTGQPSSSYRDQDVTEASLNTAYMGYTGSAGNAGSPVSWMVPGAGYQLELLVQRVEWSTSSSVALTIERLMPQTGVAIHIFVIARNPADVDDPDSRLWQKLNQLTFTVP
ncbi:hypothetical protein GCM10011490_20390 [Pseudoclavibacter endophyticus]|uniref:Uncharacterized protein n=1 Tax=Pseudoclavibacter endophyticus TaxID=1778590 RepID=A0A6H9WI09_9MICO|nr:hypothetical protein [Pseudoclavibacter endophyticus]KAB1648097.1 hypothetical protein F8O04_10235 [Pseudoclavibacter endophyticus]GGA69691.1 hypothetical protein GCM10011490_20390 [Pseudoclavibacter endophyticus]